MEPVSITTSVRNRSGSWEVIDREKWDGTPLDQVEVFAHDIGGEPGQLVCVELRNADDIVIGLVQTKAK